MFLLGFGVFILLSAILTAQIPPVEQTIQPDKILKGENWIDTKGYHAARQELEHLYTFLSTREEKRDILFVLLQCAFEDQEYENAYQWSSDFLTEYPNDGKISSVRFIHGVSAFQTERSEDALQTLDMFITESINHPTHGAGHFWRAMVKLEKGDWQSAEADVQNCFEDSSAAGYHDIALMGWALSLERRGEYQKAIDLLKKLLNDFPQSTLISDVKVRLASLFLRVGLPSQTIQVLDTIKPLSHQKQEFALLRAEADLQLNHFESSQTEYKNLLREYPESRYARKAQYGLAWSYLKKRDYAAAQKEFDSLGIGNDSIALMALYQSGVLALLQNRPMDAIARFDTLTEHSPYDNIAENAYYQMGMAHYRGKHYREARRAFQLAARLFPESKHRARSYRMLGETNMALSDFSNAQYAFSRIRQLNGSTDLAEPSMFQEGVCLYHLGRFKSSADLFADYLKRFSKNEHASEAYVWRGEALYQDGKYVDAERSYADALRLFPNNPKGLEAMYGIAWTFFEQKKFSQAAASFDRFIAQYPSNERILDATLRQADCYYFMGEYEKSSALYVSITNLKKNSQHAEYAAFQIAMSYIQRGEAERGIVQLRDFLSRFPASLYNEIVQFNIGWTYFSKNQYQQAIMEFRLQMNQYPESQLMPRVLFNMGDAFYNLHQYDSARVYYQRVPKEFPASPLVTDALQGLQYTYEAEGKPAAAIAQIDTLLTSSSSGIHQEELLMKKGDILFGQGDFAGAAIEYRKLLSLKLAPATRAKAYYQLARAFDMENNALEASAYYEKILSDFPNVDFAPNAALALGLAQIKAKQNTAAVKSLQGFETKYPDSPLLSEARYNLALALLDQKDKKPAFIQFQNLIQKHPDDVFADRSRLQIARLHIGKKEFKASLDTLNNLINRRNDDLAAEALLMVGENYLSLKRPQDALQAFKDVYDQYTEFMLLTERAHLGAGECYTRLRNVKQARTEYEKIVNSAVDPVVKKDAQERLKRLQR